MRAMVTESEKDLKLLNRTEWAIIVFYASVRECEKKRHENSRDSMESTLVAHNKWSGVTRRGIKNSIHIRAHSHSLPVWVCVCVQGLSVPKTNRVSLLRSLCGGHCVPQLRLRGVTLQSITSLFTLDSPFSLSIAIDTLHFTDTHCGGPLPAMTVM